MKKLHLLSFFVFVLVIAAIPAAGQQNRVVDVSVSGIDGALLENVLSRLSLMRLQNSEEVTESMVQGSYGKSEEEIRTALEPFGYYSPVVDKSITRDGNLWQVRISVVPGPPVSVVERDLQLEGEGRDNRTLVDAASSFPLQQGDILDHQRYKKGKAGLSSAAVAEGYRDASFSRSIVEVDRQERTARIFLTLDTGPRYLFGETTFAADFLSEKLLRRMLPYSEGDPFSPRKIVQMRQSFLNSDYFSQVEVRTGDAGTGEAAVPVFIDLTPKNRHKYGLGIGYGTDTGIRGTLEWTDRLVNRYGHQFKLRLQPSERKSEYGMVYTIPVNDPRRDRLSLLGNWLREYYDNTETEAWRTSISYDHIAENGEYSIYLEFLDEDYEIGLETGHATLLKPGMSLTWRVADDRLKTRKGISATLNVTGANEDIASDVTFLQASLYSKGIFTFWRQWRIIGRAQVGGTLVDTVSDLPPSLRFYAGGDQSVRGFAYKSIGPADSAGNIVGAKHLVSYSLELERKLFGNWSGALFFDSGDAPNALTDLNMKNGAGVGIRWNAPFGQVRLDVANAVSEGKTSWRIHFNVGADL
ncbi:MAG: autotransporter assembly complex protein TamA [Desulfobulbaceae bacterium]|nr:autotransporter assembly complex protein TamA [Desulfobulbaceae bacterium]